MRMGEGNIVWAPAVLKLALHYEESERLSPVDALVKAIERLCLIRAPRKAKPHYTRKHIKWLRERARQQWRARRGAA